MARPISEERDPTWITSQAGTCVSGEVGAQQGGQGGQEAAGEELRAGPRLLPGQLRDEGQAQQLLKLGEIQ